MAPRVFLHGAVPRFEAVGEQHAVAGVLIIGARVNKYADLVKWVESRDVVAFRNLF